MFTRKFLRPAPLLALGLSLAAAWPAAASLQYSRVTGFFEDSEGILIVHGSVPGQQVLRIDDPVIEKDPVEEGERITLLLHTAATSGPGDEIARQVVIPRLKPGLSRLVVVGEDVASGFRTEHLEWFLLPDPPLEITFGSTRLSSADKLPMRARFTSSFGLLPGTFEVKGDKIRVPLVVGCFYCPIPFPVSEIDVTAEIGPLPPGQWTLEVYGEDPAGEDSDLVFRRQPITVLPSPATVRGGRFSIEIPLDPPHQGAAQLTGLPSQDSALFYFFSPDNWEVMVKVLDGCAINGFYWVFGAASTDVGYTVRVHDNAGGGSREYRHPAGAPAPAITDAAAFACAPGEGASR